MGVLECGGNGNSLTEKLIFFRRKNNMEEKERHEILLEHIAKDVRMVAEGHISLNQKIDRNHEESRRERESIKQQMGIYVKTLSEKIDINREKIEQVDQKVEINREAIDLNRRKIEEVDQKVEINREKIEEVDNKLSSGLKTIDNHEKRINVLEVIN